MCLLLKVQHMLTALHKNIQKEFKAWNDPNVLQTTIMLHVPRNQNVLQLLMNYSTKMLRVRL